MHKTPVRSYLDYWEIIYHIPSLNCQTNPGVTLTWKRLKARNTKLPLLLQVHGRAQTGQSFTKNWVGDPIVVVAGVFFRFTLLQLT